MCLQLNLCVLCVSRIVEQASGEFVIEHATNRRVNRSHVDQTAPHRLSKRGLSIDDDEDDLDADMDDLPPLEEDGLDEESTMEQVD